MAEKANATKQYFILLHERNGEKVEKKYASSHNDMKKFVTVGRGEILEKKIDQKTTDPLAMQRFNVVNRPSVYVECCAKEVKLIDEEEARLLLPLCTLDDRLRLLIDAKALEIGKKLTIGSYVFVSMQTRTQSKSTRDFEGIIRYKGPVDGFYGTMFGVEIVETSGRGSTNGYFRGKQYFKCPAECGVFVPFDKLKLHRDLSKIDKENKDNAADENNSGIMSKVKKFAEGVQNYVLGEHEETSFENHSGHKLNDRVWVFINEKPYCGTIKYIGVIPEGKKQIFVGLLLDHPVGLGNGECHGKQLFVCPMNQAHFTPIENVISKAKFSEFFEQPNGVRVPSGTVLKDNSPSAPQTEADIVKMESNFSKKSKEQVIKEQERLLEKIKQEEKQKIAEKQERRGIETSLVEHWKSKNENPPTVQNVSEVKFQVNSHYGDPRSPTAMTHPPMANISPQNKMDVGSMVEVLSKHQNPKYGVIRWLGFLPNSDNKIAGLELEEEMNACTDGTFLGKRYFTCPSRRGFFVHLHNCLPDSRFNRNSIENPGSRRLTGGEFGPYDSKIVENAFIPPPESLEIYLKEGARGIQGHHNSCYLDATLFAAFAFSSVMDSILLRPRNDKDIKEYERVQTVLRNNIVYPLRNSGFVRADRVMDLRELLDRLGTVGGLVGEEKDPEEFLLTLLQQVLKSEPFLKIKSGKEVRNEYFYQVLADKDVERVLPSVEELLKRSFHQSNLKLTEVPSCLIVQMPRFGKGFKMYNRILPSLTINIGELVENSPQDCAVCGRLALYHCRECFTVTGSEDTDSSGNFCKECHERFHSHVKRAKHKFQPIAVSREIRASYDNKPVEHREMELFAVICIETSHYVTFVKCEELSGVVKWCFFDSMADRIGTKNGYNVPSVTECPEIIEWLSLEKQNRERIINTNDKDMPDRVRRLLGDAYVCLYESKEMAMYK